MVDKQGSKPQLLGCVNEGGIQAAQRGAPSGSDRECSSVALQGLMARVSAACSRKAEAAGEWTSGVSSASNTQVSR